MKIERPTNTHRCVLSALLLIVGLTTLAQAQPREAPQPAQAPQAAAAPSVGELNEARAELREAQKELRKLTDRIGDLSRRLGQSGQHESMLYLSENKRAIIGVVLGSNKDGDPIIRGVTPGSSAAADGVHSGDRIISVNGELMEGGKKAVENAFDAIGELEEGDVVTLSLERDGVQTEHSLTAKRMAPKSWVFNFNGDQIVPPNFDVKVMPDMLEQLGTLRLRNLEESEVFKSLNLAKFAGGLKLTTLTKDLARYFDTDRGVLVLSVSADSEFSDLEAGDVITAIDGNDCETENDVWKILRSTKTGDSVEFELVREGQPLLADATLRDHGPSFGYRFWTDDD